MIVTFIRVATYALLAACVLVAVFDEQAVSLFLGLLLLAMAGVLILTVRRKARQSKRWSS
jgi:hypothetical protein